MYNQSDITQALIDNCLMIPNSNICSFSITGTSEARTADLENYPNPANDKVTLQLGEQLRGDLTLTNFSGQVLLSQTIPANSELMEINVSKIPQGIYLLIGNGRDGTIYREKVIIAGR